MEKNQLETSLDSLFYSHIRDILNDARHKVYHTANHMMVEAYWQIGKSIVEKLNGKRGEYGKNLISQLSKQMTQDFGKGFDERNLRHMKNFYSSFPKWNAVRSELSWTHYRLLLKVEKEQTRNFYMEECIKAGWSTRQLERQINSLFYERLLVSKDKKAVSNEIYKVQPTPKMI